LVMAGQKSLLWRPPQKKKWPAKRSAARKRVYQEDGSNCLARHNQKIYGKDKSKNLGAEEGGSKGKKKEHLIWKKHGQKMPGTKKKAHKSVKKRRPGEKKKGMISFLLG